MARLRLVEQLFTVQVAIRLLPVSLEKPPAKIINIGSVDVWLSHLLWAIIVVPARSCRLLRQYVRQSSGDKARPTAIQLFLFLEFKRHIRSVRRGPVVRLLPEIASLVQRSQPLGIARERVPVGRDTIPEKPLAISCIRSRNRMTIPALLIAIYYSWLAWTKSLGREGKGAQRQGAHQTHSTSDGGARSRFRCLLSSGSQYFVYLVTTGTNSA